MLKSWTLTVASFLSKKGKKNRGNKKEKIYYGRKPFSRAPYVPETPSSSFASSLLGNCVSLALHHDSNPQTPASHLAHSVLSAERAARRTVREPTAPAATVNPAPSHDPAWFHTRPRTGSQKKLTATVKWSTSPSRRA
ncbi:uncharacterized protein LY79DRAFT_51729 [Colletotrichum navitas]|uniref:Uncharacterized protein n=1 Tax=Colletotrichum navitas TaxID=681940 RepID=A0AAD8Q7T1_9PEZI|nr:uncharacterized protein LY79DRAFT_51729 [Colletotrichum navitas]KAK1596713.1 hypothetical protein LY79DRAFT_51729 [Colletotrichum navitas]